VWLSSLGEQVLPYRPRGAWPPDRFWCTKQSNHLVDFPWLSRPGKFELNTFHDLYGSVCTLINCQRISIFKNWTVKHWKYIYMLQQNHNRFPSKHFQIWLSVKMLYNVSVNNTEIFTSVFSLTSWRSMLGLLQMLLARQPVMMKFARCNDLSPVYSSGPVSEWVTSSNFCTNLKLNTQHPCCVSKLSKWNTTLRKDWNKLPL